MRLPPAGPALKVTYGSVSSPIGHREAPEADGDRYELGRGGKVATLDLGTPVGVDNVDAYRLMIESFRWR